MANVDNRPWAPHSVPNWVIKELNRRKNDIGIVHESSYSWNENGNWQNYRGPMTSWIRLFSNGTGKTTLKTNGNVGARSGFVMYGGQGFKDAYGVNTLDNANILGYDSEGIPHRLNTIGNFVNYPNNQVESKKVHRKYLPPPGIISIENTIQRERLRNVTIQWRCYGFAQLEYLTPYFLTPGIFAVVEYGWNHYNQASLLDLRNINLNNLKELSFERQNDLYDKNIKQSYGLYDVTIGRIVDFEFNSIDGTVFDCKTVIKSIQRPYDGILTKSGVKVKSDKDSSSVQYNFPDFLEKRLNKITTCILKNKNFFEPLDESEETDKSFPFSDLKNKFYDGKPEDRIFVGRNKEYEGDDIFLKGKSSYDWDYTDNKKQIWVTLGFLIELSNIFFSVQFSSNTANKDIPIYKIINPETQDDIISAHPNLISTNGSVLLIPNARAPKYNLGFRYPQGNPKDNDYQKQNADVGSLFLSEKKEDIKAKDINSLVLYNKSLFKVFQTGKSAGTISDKDVDIGYWSLFFGELRSIERNQGVAAKFGVYRDDLDQIINRFRYRTLNKIATEFGESTVAPGTFSFPQWVNQDPNVEGNKEAGYWGRFSDLYIGIDTILNAAKSTETVGEFYEQIFSEINNCVGKFWELAIIEDENAKGLRIIDKKYVDIKSQRIYQFDVGTTNSILKNISFSAKLSNVVSNQTIYGGLPKQESDNTNGPNGLVNTNQPLQFVYGDRFYEGPQPRNNNIQNRSNTDVIKQLQTCPQSSDENKGLYIMSFKSYEARPDFARQAAVTGGGGFVTTTPPIETLNVVNLALPNESLLISILNDLDFKNNTTVYSAIQPNFNVEITLHGVSGFRTFQLFSLKNLPSPYSDKEVIFQIRNVTHRIEEGNWSTIISAGVRGIYNIIDQIRYTSDGENEYRP